MRQVIVLARPKLAPVLGNRREANPWNEQELGLKIN